MQPLDGPENLCEPQTSSSGGHNFNWTTFTTAPEEPDPENLGKRIKNLSKDEAKQLYYYLRCKYGIGGE